MFLKRIKWIVVASLVSLNLFSQGVDRELAFFEPADTFNQKRFYTALGFSTFTYAGFSAALYKTWYQQYPQERFHLFDDYGEWKQMDKAGHLYTAYFQSVLCYKGARWTGLSENRSILAGAICGGLFQSTIEVMDGFSTEWGFSLTDMSANALGLIAFTWQQKAWGEQRILLKQSGYPGMPEDVRILSDNGAGFTSLKDRKENLFGRSFTERYLKDYNIQTYWVSTSLRRLTGMNSIPAWLNIAAGYGAENMYGGRGNSWSEGGNTFSLDPDLYPRYRQYYLSLDVDFSKIKTRSHFLKSLLSVLNILKAPSPAIEVNSLGEVQFHLVFW